MAFAVQTDLGWFMDICLSGYAYNLIVICMTVIVGIVSIIVSKMYYKDSFASNFDKVKYLHDELNRSMTDKHKKLEKRRTLYALIFPFGMFLPFVSFFSDCLVTGGNIHLMYIRMGERLKKRYRL